MGRLHISFLNKTNRMFFSRTATVCRLLSTKQDKSASHSLKQVNVLDNGNSYYYRNHGASSPFAVHHKPVYASGVRPGPRSKTFFDMNNTRRLEAETIRDIEFCCDTVPQFRL